jgi:TPR repeat protein
MVVTIVGLCVALLGFHTQTASTQPRADVRAQESGVQLTAHDIAQLQAQAASGDAAAQLKLARAYENGDSVTKNKEMAFGWYRKAAEQGNSGAQNRLGEMLRAGEGVNENKQAAVAWFHSSARQGNADAMCSWELLTITTGWIYDHLQPHAAALKVAHPLMLRAIAQRLRCRSHSVQLAL